MVQSLTEEEWLDWICEQQRCTPLRLRPDPAWNIVETCADQAGAYGYRFYPDRLSGEGFFLAVLKKEGPAGPPVRNAYGRSGKGTHSAERISKTAEKQLSHWIQNGCVQYVPVGDAIHGIPEGLVGDFGKLKNALYLKKAGIRLGKSGENDWIPDHELALADILSEKPQRLDLGKQDALDFLRGNNLEMEIRKKGWCLMRYQGFGLGWVKMLDNRMNNYYPKSWRIRQ